MYDAVDIARYIIHFCTINGNPISDIQLQKILYYIQINFYRILDKPAFTNRIEAWKYGPVIPDVYDIYKVYGDSKICLFSFGIENTFSNKELDIINRVVTMCTEVSPWELVEKSHKIGAPWEVTYSSNMTEISDATMREYAKKGM